jgi:hypothetical protein
MHTKLTQPAALGAGGGGGGAALGAGGGGGAVDKDTPSWLSHQHITAATWCVAGIVVFLTHADVC